MNATVETVTAQEYADRTGWVAFGAHTENRIRPMAHLLEPGTGFRTLCGRYTDTGRMYAGHVPADLRRCQVCTRKAAAK